MRGVCSKEAQRLGSRITQCQLRLQVSRKSWKSRAISNTAVFQTHPNASIRRPQKVSPVPPASPPPPNRSTILPQGNRRSEGRTWQSRPFGRKIRENQRKMRAVSLGLSDQAQTTTFTSVRQPWLPFAHVFLSFPCWL